MAADNEFIDQKCKCAALILLGESRFSKAIRMRVSCITSYAKNAITGPLS